MAVREGLLALLASGPRHGYQLKTELEAVTAAAKPVNIGQIYTTLDRLVRDGLVIERTGDPDREQGAAGEPEGNGDGRRRPFALTAAGLAELEDWFLTVPAASDAPPRDVLVAKVLLAVHTPRVDPAEVVRTQRAALVERLQAVRRRQRRAQDLPEQLVVDADASRLEAEIGWLDRCEERLRQQPATAPRPVEGNTPEGWQR